MKNLSRVQIYTKVHCDSEIGKIGLLQTNKVWDSTDVLYYLIEKVATSNISLRKWCEKVFANKKFRRKVHGGL